ncbi:MAG: iron-sulfur cluster assembly scaffold protein [Pseudomonadota bacterium]
MKDANPETRINTPEAGFTDQFILHAFTPQNVGIMTNPDGCGTPKGACGDTIEIGLRIREGMIEDAVFMTDGCAHTVACGSVITTLAKGLTINQALGLQAAQIEDALGGLPPEHAHCARLAVTSLRLAIKDYLKNLNAPWKKLYESRERR